MIRFFVAGGLAVALSLAARPASVAVRQAPAVPGGLSETGVAAISGLVLNHRRAPVEGAVVHAIPATALPGLFPSGSVAPRLARTNETDAQGRFQISGLPPGEYLVAAKAMPFIPTEPWAQAESDATTFYPSTRDVARATVVTARTDKDSSIVIELVRVQSVRVTGSVVSSSTPSTDGMAVRLFHQFGGHGHESEVGRVGAGGKFEIPHVSPGRYRLTVQRRQSSGGERGEFAEQLIDVGDADLHGLSLVLTAGASVSGRVVAESGTTFRTIGVQVVASRPPDGYAMSRPVSTTLADDGSFRLTGLSSGRYQFFARADRAPFIVATRVTLNSQSVLATDGVELTSGNNAVVVFVAPREPPKPVADATTSTAVLVEQFRTARYSWEQFDVAKVIVARRDASVLASLTDWLGHENRRTRGNVAFIFAGLGDPRGFQIITEILADRSDRPVQPDERGPVAQQIRSDRYYAGHLLGELRDPRAVPILIALLGDPDVKSTVPWSLEQIGDRRAIPPLIGALDNPDPSSVVMAIYALETLQANEAVPRLTALLNDTRRSTFGAQVSVGEAAKAAIAKLK